MLIVAVFVYVFYLADALVFSLCTRKDKLTKQDEAQILHYLKVSGYQLGLLINFGNRRKAEVRRFINTETLSDSD